VVEGGDWKSVDNSHGHLLPVSSVTLFVTTTYETYIQL
jgi:hypothetical protein